MSRTRATTVFSIPLCLLLTAASPPQSASQEAPDPAVAPIEVPVIEPEARAVLERAIEAMGGRERRDAVRSSRSKATLTIGELETTLHLLTMKPGRFLARQEIEGLGEMEVGSDGLTGWRKDPPDGLLTQIDVREVGDFARRYDLQGLIRELDIRSTAARVEGSTTVEDVNCIVLVLVIDEQEMRAFFDEATGLPRMLEISEGERRKAPRRVVMETWSDPGVTPPLRWVRSFRIEQPSARMNMTANYDYVTFDDVSESTFIPPHGIEEVEAAQ